MLDRFARDRVCAVLRTATAEACPKAMTAAIEGGFKIAEFTLTTPGCLDTLADFRAKYDGDGNMVDWWTDSDRAEFGTRTAARSRAPPSEAHATAMSSDSTRSSTATESKVAS